MNTQVCVNCLNKKTVNLTTNRLVTESCGHVKCMDCLVHEKSGCIACISEKSQKEFEDSLETEAGLVVESVNLETDTEDVDEEIKGIDDVVVQAVDKKEKPETSHIKIESDASGNRCYYCTVCKKKFHARSQVAYHAYCNGQRKPYQCPECSKSFATHSHYKYHMRVHRNERTYACEQCGDSFFQMSKLQRHKLKHTKEKKYACTQCSKAFNNVTSLRKHALTHSEERPYACCTCGRRFRDSSNYRKHVAKHQDKKCSCEVCARAGRAPHATHAMHAMHAMHATHATHAGAAAARVERRAHQCPRCPQAFHSSKDMRRHAQVHTDSKPFRCKVCNRRFRRKDNLERHIRNTHPDFVPSTVVECDPAQTPPVTNGHANKQTDNTDKVYETHEKTKLEILNPLPPIPQDVIKKHITEPVIEKSYIIEANHARQSVIVAQCPERKESSPATEYVHKMRKANSMRRDKDTPLPPIDETKFGELTSLNSLDIGAPMKNMEIYKKILKVGSEEGGAPHGDDGTASLSGAAHEMHWRRKMKLNINW